MSDLIDTTKLEQRLQALEKSIADLNTFNQATGDNIRTLAARVQELEDAKLDGAKIAEQVTANLLAVSNPTT